jgi:DNA polymerase-3 subunit gamma/tau
MKTVQSWAVKHRPQQFDDVVGQDDAVSRLKGYIKRGEIPNAIMFTGPSGTGKTTLARIFARYLNCATNDACGTCPSCKATPHPDIDESNAQVHYYIEVIELVQKLHLNASVVLDYFTTDV